MVVFHEENKVVMFKNLEDFFLFKDDLDYEFEEYEPKIDSVKEIESQFPVLQEFATNTQIAAIHTSLCLLLDQQPSIISDQNEGSTCIFATRSQDKVKFQIYENPFADLLQLVGKMYFLVFMDQKHMFSRNLEWPSLFFLPAQGKCEHDFSKQSYVGLVTLEGSLHMIVNMSS